MFINVHLEHTVGIIFNMFVLIVLTCMIKNLNGAIKEVDKGNDADP